MTEVRIKNVRSGLSREQRDSLVNKLNESDFFVFTPSRAVTEEGIEGPTGGVHVRRPLCDHPKGDSNNLPVGFIGIKESGKYYARLVNIDIEFPEDYHYQLREIYQSI